MMAVIKTRIMTMVMMTTATTKMMMTTTSYGLLECTQCCNLLRSEAKHHSSNKSLHSANAIS